MVKRRPGRLRKIRRLSIEDQIALFDISDCSLSLDRLSVNPDLKATNTPHPKRTAKPLMVNLSPLALGTHYCDEVSDTLNVLNLPSRDIGRTMFGF